MIHKAHVAPPNSLLLVMDQTVGQVPDSMNERLVAATPSCIAIGTVPEADGEVLVSLSDDLPSQVEDELLVFDGVLATPSRAVSVCSVLGDTLLRLDVPEFDTRVRIWANHDFEPTKVVILVGDG